MNKNAIKKYAIWARRELIDRVSKKALRFGISPEGNVDPKADSVNGELLSDTEKKQRSALIKKITSHGYEQTMEEVAYTWFNRFAALRFMEVNGYLPSHVRVFTNDAGEFKPQILAEAIHLELPGLDLDKVYALKEADKAEELFRYLIIVQCNALSEILPGMFQRIVGGKAAHPAPPPTLAHPCASDDFTELLLPDNLLREGSVIERLVTEIPEEDWRDQVQIIGWLYQYYNTEPKDKVFADLKKNIKVSKEKIPAATQLFTPDWIVRYMVENSLGRLWLEGHPNDTLKAEWKYYLDEAEQEPEVQAKLEEMRKERASLNPEDIHCIDPCMGSGHILAYLFDVLMQIYGDYGYPVMEAVESIVTKNLYGLDIDDRAAQLAYFTIMMKARSYDRGFFRRGIQPNVMAIQESNWIDGAYPYDMEDFLISKEHQDTLNYLLDAFKDAKEYGSILQLENRDYVGLLKAWEGTAAATAGDFNMVLWFAAVKNAIPALIKQAIYLSQKYDVVVTNPPYMGSSNMATKLSAFVKKNYPDTKSDMSTICMEKTLTMCKDNGYMSMINIPVWMFISSYEKLRQSILKNNTYSSMLHLGRGIFGSDFGTTSFVILKQYIGNYKGSYRRLFEKQGAVDSIDEKEQKFFSGQGAFVACQENFAKIPGAPVAYWIATQSFDTFNNEESFAEIAETRAGMITGNNDRFIRLWHEVSFESVGINMHTRTEASNSQRKWFPYSKGGAYRKWYGNNDYVVDWYNDGYELQNLKDEKGKIPAHAFNFEYIFRENITWNSLTSYKFGCRYIRCGHLFDASGSFAKVKDSRYTYVYLCLLNSPVTDYFIGALNPTINYQKGDIAKIPVHHAIRSFHIKINALAKDNIDTSQTDWDSFETSWDFKHHPLLPTSTEAAALLSDCYQKWEQECNDRFTTLKRNEEELNRIFIDIYGLQDELTPEVEDKDVTVRKADLGRDIRSLISYAVGCMMGRYSLDVPGLAYAGGEWDDSKYKTFLPDKDAILPITDDEYFDDDILARFVEFVKVVYGADTLEENLQFIADALGGRSTPREVIRNYFLTGFYADHVKTYQKRPIYWLFDSGKKNGFKCLVYMHRYRPDTIARIRTDYVHEQQSRYRTAIEGLEHGRDNAATATERVKLGKKLASIEAQAKELREYEEKIHHLADQMIAIDLDDGVKHNYAIFKDVLAKIK